jgi:predicted nucleic acid-binding protein
MNLSVWRTNINGAIVIDTSVVINLHASTQGQRILSCVPHEVVVPQVVADELESETAELLFLRKLEKDGDISIVQLDDEELEIFEQLVSDARSVDDGEAATIAVAHVRSLVPFIDDRKGRSRATELMGRDPGMVAGFAVPSRCRSRPWREDARRRRLSVTSRRTDADFPRSGVRCH